MLRYSVSYYEKVAVYWMQLRKGEEPFKARKEAEEFIEALTSFPEIYDINLIDNSNKHVEPIQKESK